MLFLAAVVTVSLGMHGYVLARLWHLWGLRRGWGFYALLPPLSLAFIAALILEARVGNGLTGAFYTLAMTSFGLCFLCLWILLLQQLLARWVPLSRRSWAVATCGLAAGLALFAAVNARAVTVRHETVSGLPLRIAHLSDIHLGSIPEAMLAEIVAATNALRPELVLITGDLFDNANTRTRAAAGLLAGFAAPVLFSAGNHETYTGEEQVRAMLAGTGIRWLRNEAAEVAGLRVIGIDNSYGTELLEGVLRRVGPSAAYTVLMSHQPVGFDLAARAGVRLMLSGHVHNGQLWPFGYAVRLVYPYVQGRHERGESLLNVSTGTGYWGPPLRLGSRSEIVLLEPAPSWP